MHEVVPDVHALHMHFSPCQIFCCSSGCQTVTDPL